MSAVTMSGYPVLGSYDDPALQKNPAVPTAPGVRALGGLRAGAVAGCLLYVASRWHNEVEHLVQGDGVWGYEYRTIRQGSAMSNHAAGAAIDLNAVRHPQGAAGTVSSAQLHEIAAIEQAVGTALNWGGRFTGRSVDAMHWQVRDDHAGKPVDDLWALIRANGVPNVPDALRSSTGAPVPPTTAPVSGPGAKRPRYPLPQGCYFGPFEGPAQSISGRGAHDGTWRPFLAAWQRRATTVGATAGPADGIYGPRTALSARAVQARAGLQIDGLIGPKTWAAVWGLPVSAQ